MGEVEAAFEAFAKQGVTNGTGKDMTNKNFSKMCKDCGIINKACTSTDVDIAFSKFKPKGGQKINFQQFQQVLGELQKKRFPNKDNATELMLDLVKGKTPGFNKATKQSKAGGVDRMTDTSKYTGSHKERFDESGKGKGLDGRAERVENSGYVGNYKGDGTYEKK